VARARQFYGRHDMRGRGAQKNLPSTRRGSTVRAMWEGVGSCDARTLQTHPALEDMLTWLMTPVYVHPRPVSTGIRSERHFSLQGGAARHPDQVGGLHVDIQSRQCQS